MKKLVLFTALTVFAIFSCQKDDELGINPSSKTSAIDPDTPLDAKPLIIDEIKSNGKTQAPPGTGWTSVFSDEFNNMTTLNTDKWTIVVSPKSREVAGRDPALTYWGWKAGRVWQNDGKLVLSSLKQDASSLYCGAVDCNNKVGGERKYGFYEASIDVQNPADGSHTAFWLQSDIMFTSDIELDGANGAEVDIFESAWTDNTSRTTIHIDGYASGHESFGGGSNDGWSAPKLDTGYHTFGLDWSKTYLKTYYDGTLKKTITGIKWIPQSNEYIILSTGASFGSGKLGFSSRAISSDTKSYVDWVRVFNKANDPNYN